MKKRLLHLTMLFLLTSAGAFAQQVVTGKITSSLDGSPLPGVSILIKGTSSGTTTDSDGKFTLKTIDATNVLVISFIGYASQEIAVNNQTTIDLVMNEDTAQLGEVVVTALGIEREKKSLGYSVQEVKGQAFQEARETNIINNLQGRVAGVQIYKGGTGPGGSSRVVIRGSNALRAGADAPMYVVDGVPFDNYNTSTGQSEYGSMDTGQGIAQLNPDDIETMTVLKGPEAGALYGNRGANGVILITTKKGRSKKGVGVTYSNNLTFDSPLLLPKMQNSYGQGNLGSFSAVQDGSWGPLAAGQTITDWTGKQVPMKIVKNDIKQFITTGRTETNSVDISGGDDRGTFRVGYTNMNNHGLVPTSKIIRNMATLRATYNLTSKLTADVKISYSRQEGFNRVSTSGSVYNPFGFYTNKPRSIAMGDMRPWKDENGLMIIYRPTEYSTIINPYWNINENSNYDKTDRVLTMARLDYKFTPWLKAFVRHGMDANNQYTQGVLAWGMGNPTDAGSYNYSSGYQQGRSFGTETNADFLVTANKTAGNLSVSISGGGNTRTNHYDNQGGNTNTLVFPSYYNLKAGTQPRPYSEKSQQKVNSLYTFVNLSYKNALFLDATYRNDWSSTVSPKNRSFNYYALSGSAVISDLVTLPSAISYWKVRGGFAQTGNSIDPYNLTYTYPIGPGFNNAQSTSAPVIQKNPNILPEKVNSLEIGTDIRLYQGRVGLELAYYKKSTTNQIIPLQKGGAGAAGYNTEYINAGDVVNQGIEFVLNTIPVKTTDFVWNLSFNFNHNVNKVKELTPTNERYFLQGDEQSRAVRVVADKNRPAGDLYGRDFARNADGKIVVDANGVPIKSADKVSFLGNYQPKYTLGIVNSLSYRSLTFGFVIDARVGGVMYSQTLANMYANGNAAGTLAHRDGGLIVDGVYNTGTPNEGAANTSAITSQQYWQSVGSVESVASAFVYSATNIRLREMTLIYALPPSIIAKTPFTKISGGIVGRNLWIIKSYLPGIDPESSFNVTNAQGIENSSYPSYRSIGFNISLGF